MRLTLMMTLAVLIGALVAADAHAEGSKVRITYSGTVTSVTNYGATAVDVEVGDPMSGAITYDTWNASDYNVDEYVGDYDLQSGYHSADMEVTAGGVSAGMGLGPSSLDIDIDALEAGFDGESFRARTGGGSGAFRQTGFGTSYDSIYVYLDLRQNNSAVDAIPSDDLPTSSYDLALFTTQKTVRIQASEGAFMGELSIVCEITSLTLEVLPLPVYVSGSGEQLIVSDATVIDGYDLREALRPRINDDRKVLFRGRGRNADGSNFSNLFLWDLDTGTGTVAVEGNSIFAGDSIGGISHAYDMNDAGDIYFVSSVTGVGPSLYRLYRKGADGSESVIWSGGDTIGTAEVWWIDGVAVTDAPASTVFVSGLRRLTSGADREIIGALNIFDGIDRGDVLVEFDEYDGRIVENITGSSLQANDSGRYVVEIQHTDGSYGIYRGGVRSGTDWWIEAELVVNSGESVIDGETIVEAWTPGFNDGGRIVFPCEMPSGFAIAEPTQYVIGPSAGNFEYAYDPAINDGGDLVFVGRHDGKNALFYLAISNTETGDDVVATAGEDGEATLTFESITETGETSVVELEGTPTLPEQFDFSLGESGQPTSYTYMEISTTATFDGTIELCIEYDESLYVDEASVVLLHYDESVSRWVNITTSVDTTNNLVCGSTTSLSPFAIAQRAEGTIVSIDLKPTSTKNPVNLKAGGNVPVAILSSNTFDATTVDPSTVIVSGAGVKRKSNGTYQSDEKDVDGDGLDDLLVHVPIRDLSLAADATSITLYGTTFDGQNVEGTDAVDLTP